MTTQWDRFPSTLSVLPAAYSKLDATAQRRVLLENKATDSDNYEHVLLLARRCAAALVGVGD